MDIEIKDKKGNTFLLSETGFEIKDFVVSSIEMEDYSEDVEGRHGRVDYGADYRKRTIKAPFIFKPRELHEFAHGRDLLFDKLVSTEGYYIREMRRARKKEYAFVKPLATETAKLLPQSENTYVNGQHYFVRLKNIIEIDQKENYSEGVLEFETIMLPFSETVYTTMQLHAQGYDENTDLHGTADNINFDYTTYSFTTNEFDVWNAGSMEVSPESMYFVIGVVGLNSDSTFVIENVTNGSKFTLNKPMATKNVVINGVKVTEGIYNILRDTNKTFITLEKGLNHIKVTGGTFTKINFDFRYYYK